MHLKLASEQRLPSKSFIFQNNGKKLSINYYLLITKNAPLAFLLHLATAMCNLHAQVVLILLNRYSLPHSGTAIPSINSTTHLPMTFPLPFNSNKTNINYKFVLALSKQDLNILFYNQRYSVIADVVGSNTQSGVTLELSTKLTANLIYEVELRYLVVQDSFPFMETISYRKTLNTFKEIGGSQIVGRKIFGSFPTNPNNYIANVINGYDI